MSSAVKSLAACVFPEADAQPPQSPSLLDHRPPRQAVAGSTDRIIARTKLRNLILLSLS